MDAQEQRADDPIAPAGPEMIAIDPAAVGMKATYKLLIGAIVPRPIAFISTIGPNGVGNLAPYSFFNGVASKPAAVMVAITRKQDGGKRYAAEYPSERAVRHQHRQRNASRADESVFGGVSLRRG